MTDTPIWDSMASDPGSLPDPETPAMPEPAAEPPTQERDLAPDPFAGNAGTSPDATTESPATQEASASDGEMSTDAVHSYQVTHKTANPENPENHSLVTTAWMTLSELDDFVANLTE